MAQQVTERMSPNRRQLRAITEMYDDYWVSTSTPDGAELPETQYLEKIDDTEAKLRFITYGSACNYVRPANAHWKIMWELYTDRPEYFNPTRAAELGTDYLGTCFGAYGVRFKNNDANAWIAISQFLEHIANGSVQELLELVDYDADRLASALEDNSVPHLTGSKIQPFYFRLLRTTGVGLTGSDFRIPVDVQVRKATSLLAPQVPEDDDAIRHYWHSVAQYLDEPMYRIDPVIWLGGRSLESWVRPICEKHRIGNT